MGLGKSFGISFLIFIVLNFALNILGVVLGSGDIGAWFGGVTSQPMLWIANFFVVGAMTNPITGINMGIASLIGGGDLMTGLMMLLAALLPGLIAAIVAGKTADSPGQGLMGIMLTTLISAVILLVLMIVDTMVMNSGDMLVAIAWMLVLAEPAGYALMAGVNWATYLFVPLLGIFNGLLWGGIAAPLGKEI